jgi:hypothetical protein
MEVHPPEHPIMTWKQFFIHMSTICLGLLIALGLEQLAEDLHHRHQLHVLREALQAEDEKALRDLDGHEAYYNAAFAWYSARMEQTRQAIRHNTPLPDLAKPGMSVHSVPNDPAWLAAKASNLIDIMPQQEIIAHSEVEALTRLVHDNTVNNVIHGRRSSVIAEPFRAATGSESLDFSSASKSDLTEYLQALAEEAAFARQKQSEAAWLRGALQAVLRGERNLDRIDDEENRSHEDMLKSRQQTLQSIRINSVDPTASARNTDRSHRAAAGGTRLYSGQSGHAFNDKGGK